MSKTQLAGMSLRARDASRGIRVGRSMVAAVMMALVVTWAAPASAQQAKCLAGKTKCMASLAAGLLKCDETAETPGKTADPTCKPTVEGKFDGGADVANGCFGKLENKKGSDCSPGDNTTAAENAVDSCVTGFVADIDPSATQSKCLVGKKKCVAKLLGSLLKCEATAQTPGKSTETSACDTKATDKYTGGMDQTKGCFAKLEAKDPTGCAPLNNSDTLETDAVNCRTALVALEHNTTTTTTTTTSSTTTTTCPAAPLAIMGALPSTPGRFNFAGLGVDGATLACSDAFACTHACTLEELETVPKSELAGLKDTTNMAVTSFWAIDSSAPDLEQCVDDAMGGSGKVWEYGTAHTPSRGEKVDLNTDGSLGGLDATPPPNAKPDAAHMMLQCNISGNAWVGCCR